MKRYAPFGAKAVATVVAGTVAGAIAGGRWGLLSGTLRLAVRAQLVLLLAVLLAGASLLRIPVLQRDVETPQGLLAAGPLLWAAGNGALLGVAITSRIGFWAWYVLPLGVLYLARADLGLVIGGSFGFFRLAVLVSLAEAMHSRPGRAASLADGLIALRGRIRPALAAVSVLAAAVIAIGAA